MSVMLNGNTYTADGSNTNYDLVGTDGYGYKKQVGGSELFPSRIFNDLLATLSAAAAVGGVAPGAAGAVLYSNGSAWVRSASPIVTSVGVGGATPASGGGIQFPATQSASSDANMLDDYEEGTWTPQDNTGSNLTNAGSGYVKIGQLVMLTFDATWTADTTALLKNLPFPVKANRNCGSVAAYVSGAQTISVELISSTTTAQLYNAQNSTVSVAGLRFQVSILYQTSA